MATTKPKKSHAEPGWAEVKAQLEALPRPALMKLMRALFVGSSENQVLIAAAAQHAADASIQVPTEEALEPFRKRINVAFFGRGNIPSDGCPHLAVALKVIHDYKKTHGNLIGTLDLMLTYLDCGTDLTVTYGDMEQPFYDSLSHMLGELAGLLQSPTGKPHLPLFKERLRALRALGRELAWEIGRAHV